LPWCGGPPGKAPRKGKWKKFRKKSGRGRRGILLQRKKVGGVGKKRVRWQDNGPAHGNITNEMQKEKQKKKGKERGAGGKS